MDPYTDLLNPKTVNPNPWTFNPEEATHAKGLKAQAIND